MKETSEHIKSIEKKISELRSLDKSFVIFGSKGHEYKFGSKISENEVAEFERKHTITLPHSYREFILHFGNGGCGPSYGIMNLASGILDNPFNRTESEIINLSNPFRFETSWNLEHIEDDDLWDKEYDLAKWCDGMLRICHEGCGYFVNIVVTGKEKGNVWIDGRVSDGGIYPVKHHTENTNTTFTEWYLSWLNNAIEELRATKDNNNNTFWSKLKSLWS